MNPVDELVLALGRFAERHLVALAWLCAVLAVLNLGDTLPCLAATAACATLVVLAWVRRRDR